ncbi:MAG: hypothetical protein DMG59_10890 [Acidobacteria bacterium]|nr:MAG: hypothetical protein DMG59_10890 [Acidobacteriota bacterium]
MSDAELRRQYDAAHHMCRLDREPKHASYVQTFCERFFGMVMNCRAEASWGTIGEPMSDVISEYQKWKQQGDDLRLKAKQAMESRFRALLSEAARIAEEYRTDFGAVLKPPSPVTAFRYKAHARMKTKKATKPKSAAKIGRAEPRAEPVPQKPNRKVVGLQKRLTAAKRKLDEAKASGTPTRPLEDRVYEIEDELRLAGQAV